MTDPLAEIREIEKQSAKAWDEYSHAAKLRQESELELARAKRAVDQIHKLRPQGRATDKEVKAAERRVNEAQDAHDQWRSRENHALSAAKGLDLDRDDKLRQEEYAEAYANEADKATQAAVAQLAVVQDALGQAREAWALAAQAWAPLCKAHAAQAVPPCPLPAPESVAGMVPRPLGVRAKP